MRQKEVQPLLSGGIMQPRGKTSDTFYIPEEKVNMGDEFEDEILMTERKRKRRVSMLWHDCLLLSLEFFQFLAVLQSMALRWTWSPSWLTNSYFFFIFNFDFYEFFKLHTSGVYIAIQNYYTPSNIVPCQFTHMVIAWFCVSLVLPAVFILVYFIFYRMNHPNFFTYVGYLRMVYFWIIQFLTIPVGTFIAHTFQCNDIGQVDMKNDLQCFEGLHWLYVSFALLLSVFLFIVFPVYLVYKTRQESLGSCSKHHESFLLLKETEYKVGLNKSWLISDLYLFSSFRFWGLYSRAIMQWIKMTILIVLFAGFKDIKGQSLAVTILFFICFVVVLVFRPYRLLCFNLIWSLSFLALASLSLVGAMSTHYTALTLSTPWLLPQYSKWILGVIVVLWAAFWLLFVVYLCITSLLYRCKCLKATLWPTFSTSDNDRLSCETKKFLKTFLRARYILEKTQRGPPIFAPVHDLARQIEILNAYCREAEFLGDALHGTMWDLLDEMVEIHTKLSSKSLFAESVKESIRRTANQFLSVMPSFAQRLAQRDYDFILVSPMKKRMLLKMYIMGVFLNGRTEKVRKEQLLTRPALEQIWHEEPLSKDTEEEEGYYEDLYPDPMELIRDDSSLDLSMDSSEPEDEMDFSHMMDNLKEEEEMNAELIRQEGDVLSSRTSLRPSSAASSKVQPLSGSVVNVSEGMIPGEVLSSAEVGSSSRPSSAEVRGSSRPSSAEHGKSELDTTSQGKGDSTSMGHDNPALSLKDEEEGESKLSDIIASADEVLEMKVKGQDAPVEKKKEKKVKQRRGSQTKRRKSRSGRESEA